MTTLSILCVTRCEPHALPFLHAMARLAHNTHSGLIVCADGEDARETLWAEGFHAYLAESGGFIESVLDQCIAKCHGEYILRLDDDEQCSPALAAWLHRREWLAADHWAFPRANLWGDAESVLVNAPLWPDLQTRLSVKAKAGGRHGVHDGSPFGTGRIAPAVIEHHKYLIKSRAEREAQAAHYDALRPGAGTDPHFWPFMVPETAYERIGLRLAPLGDGDAGAIEAATPRVLAVMR